LLYSKRIPLTLLLSLSLFSSASYAEQDYHVELTGEFEKEDEDTSTAKSSSVSAEIFFSPVSTDNKPLAEAAFLNKSSSIALGYIKSKTELQSANVDSFEVSGPLILINYITATDAYILSAIYGTVDLDTNNNLITGDTKISGINIGKYLDDTSTIEFSYINNDIENRNTTTNQKFINKTDSYTISYKTVQTTDAVNYYSLAADIELIKSDSNTVKEDNHEFGVAGEYYFSLMTSIGAAALFNSGDDISQEGRTLGVSLTHFLLPQIALKLGLGKFDAKDNKTEDSDSVSVEVSARF